MLILSYIILYNSTKGCEVRVMRPLKLKVSITLDSDLAERVRSLAEEEERSFSQYINMVLREHLNRLDQFDNP